jgi:hypothetical protein
MTANDGTALEHRVAIWAKKHYGGSVRERLLVNGPAKRPYEVDVSVRVPRLISFDDIWIECRDRRDRVKVVDILDLVGKGRHVFQACASGKQEFYFNRLVLVSTSPFDTDALNLADHEGVECFLYDGQRYIQQNTRKITFNEKWLRDAKATV